VQLVELAEQRLVRVVRFLWLVEPHLVVIQPVERRASRVVRGKGHKLAVRSPGLAVRPVRQARAVLQA
jgi:hypothetical protein